MCLTFLALAVSARRPEDVSEPRCRGRKGARVRVNTCRRSQGPDAAVSAPRAVPAGDRVQAAQLVQRWVDVRLRQAVVTPRVTWGCCAPWAAMPDAPRTSRGWQAAPGAVVSGTAALPVLVS